MTQTRGLWGFFDGDIAAAEAIRALRRADTRFTLYAPFMTHELDHALDEQKASPVRLFVLAGGLAGLVAGFALTIWTATRWNLIVGGKPIIAFPSFFVIAFELTLLVGALATLLGLLVLSRLPSSRRSPGYDAGLTCDRFGVRVTGDDEQLARSREILQQAGAAEIRDGSDQPSPAAGVSDA